MSYFFLSISIVVLKCSVGVVCPLGEDSLVKIHEDGVLLGDLTVEDALHVSVCPQRFLDVTPPPVLRPQFHRLEPFNVLTVEEHESYRANPLMNFEWVTREDCSFDNDSVGVIIQQRTCGK